MVKCDIFERQFESLGVLRSKVNVRYLRDDLSLGVLRSKSKVGYLGEDLSFGVFRSKVEVGYLWEDLRLGVLRPKMKFGYLAKVLSLGVFRSKLKVGYLGEDLSLDVLRPGAEEALTVGGRLVARSRSCLHIKDNCNNQPSSSSSSYSPAPRHIFSLLVCNSYLLPL